MGGKKEGRAGRCHLNSKKAFSDAISSVKHIVLPFLSRDVTPRTFLPFPSFFPSRLSGPQVIYNFLEWGAGGDGGRRGLILLGLSNTVDLPERVMQVGRNAWRAGGRE